MQIKIRHVAALNGDYGETSFPGPKKAVITIARNMNRRMHTYSSTMLHELLHVWTHVLELNGFKMDEEVEHDFIYATERAVVKKFRQIVGKSVKGKRL